MTTLAVSPAPAEARRLRRAGFASRLVADGVDFVLVELLFTLGLFGVALARYLLTSTPFELPRPHIAVTSGAEVVLLIAYLGWGWSSTGRTPGKALLGLRVVTDRGQPLSLARAVARATICALVPLLLLWALVSRRNAAVYDIVLSTAVVYDWQPRRPTRTRPTTSSEAKTHE